MRAKSNKVDMHALQKDTAKVFSVFEYDEQSCTCCMRL